MIPRDKWLQWKDVSELIWWIIIVVSHRNEKNIYFWMWQRAFWQTMNHFNSNGLDWSDVQSARDVIRNLFTTSVKRYGKERKNKIKNKARAIALVFYFELTVHWKRCLFFIICFHLYFCFQAIISLKSAVCACLFRSAFEKMIRGDI